MGWSWFGPGDAATSTPCSTAEPGLAAKPIIDITAEEQSIAPLLTAGYRLRVSEPGQRVARTPELDVHVHSLQTGDSELFERTKRSLAAMEWPT